MPTSALPTDESSKSSATPGARVTPSRKDRKQAKSTEYSAGVLTIKVDPKLPYDYSVAGNVVTIKSTPDLFAQFISVPWKDASGGIRAIHRCFYNHTGADKRLLERLAKSEGVADVRSDSGSTISGSVADPDVHKAPSDESGTVYGSHLVLVDDVSKPTVAYLFQERDKKLNFPGGKRDGSEPPFDTLKRELKEEEPELLKLDLDAAKIFESPGDGVISTLFVLSVPKDVPSTLKPYKVSDLKSSDYCSKNNIAAYIPRQVNSITE